MLRYSIIGAPFIKSTEHMFVVKYAYFIAPQMEILALLSPLPEVSMGSAGYAGTIPHTMNVGMLHRIRRSLAGKH